MDWACACMVPLTLRISHKMYDNWYNMIVNVLSVTQSIYFTVTSPLMFLLPSSPQAIHSQWKRVLILTTGLKSTRTKTLAWEHILMFVLVVLWIEQYNSSTYLSLLESSYKLNSHSKVEKGKNLLIIWKWRKHKQQDRRITLFVWKWRKHYATHLNVVEILSFSIKRRNKKKINYSGQQQ